MKTISVHFTRLESGLWGYSPGDIYSAYSAQTIAECNGRVRVFTHEARLWTNTGGWSDHFQAAAHCYQLILPEAYRGPDSVPYSYEGRTVAYKGRKFRLGPKTEFRTTDRTVAEWREALRRYYERGGYFTSDKTHHQLLRGYLENPDREPPKGNIVTAIKLELAAPDFNKHLRNHPQASDDVSALPLWQQIYEANTR